MRKAKEDGPMGTEAMMVEQGKRAGKARAAGMALAVLAFGLVFQACGKKQPAGDQSSEVKPQPAQGAVAAATKPAAPAGLPQIKGKDGASMVEIPAGEFTMGSDAGEPDEKPAHRVKLAAFLFDVYPVTNGQFATFLNAIGRSKDGAGRLLVWEFRRGMHRVGNRWEAQKDCDRNPAIGVTWYGATAYAKHYGKRLPTEAEWEYACRAGSTAPWSFGSEGGRLGDFAWFQANAGQTVHPVGEKPANAWGVSDMHGGVWEWCADWYSGEYYERRPHQNPKGPESGRYRVLRGGSRLNSAVRCRSSNRGASDPDDKDGTIGFRCAASAK